MPRLDPDAGPCGLYRMFGADGALLYVGASAHVIARVAAHGGTKPWFCDVVSITIEWHPTRRECERAEAAAIRSECPRHNVQYTPRIRERFRKQRAGGVLRAWLEKKQMSVAQFAARVGIEPSTIGAYIRCSQRPNRRNALRIERATNGDLPEGIWGRGGRVPDYYGKADLAKQLLCQHGAFTTDGPTP